MVSGRILQRIKKEAFDYFSNIFSAVRPDLRESIQLQSNLFKRLSVEESSFLEAKFSESEVLNAVKSCDSSKAPAPDGFNFKFKNFWSVIKPELMEAFTWFWENGYISRGLNATLVSLVPKIADPLSMKDYRPISLVGAYYKIIAKVLAERLKKLLVVLLVKSKMPLLKVGLS